MSLPKGVKLQPKVCIQRLSESAGCDLLDNRAGVLAPLQFVVFLVSLALVLRFMLTGEGYWLATVSIVVKTLVLYTIMITGAIWEKVVFGQYLLAPAFFWEDVVSFLVIGLHTAYLYLLFNALVDQNTLMLTALAAYFLYVINAAQFLLKLRMARLEGTRELGHA